MKRSFEILASAAAVVAMLGACQKEQVNSQDNGSEQKVAELFGTFTVKADYTEPVAEASTKTALVDVDNPYVKWLLTVKINMWEFVDGTENACFQTAQDGTHLGDNDKSATFDISLNGTNPEGSTYCYTAIYPDGAVTKNGEIYSFEIPATQTLVNGNFAANADILVGKPVVQNTRISGGSSVSVQFKRPGTAVKLTLKGITAGELISSVKITAPEGQKIAGCCKIDLTTGEVSDKAYENGTNEITLICGNIAATGNDVFYFRCLDGTWASGSSVSIRVETNNAIYTKTVSLPRDYVFADGGLTKFGFQGMTRDAIITHNSPVGTIGMLDGEEGIVVELPTIQKGEKIYYSYDMYISSKKIVIATKNYGAESSEDYGPVFDISDDWIVSAHTHGWRHPSINELYALSQLTNKEWQETGCKWSFEDTYLFFPSSGKKSGPNKGEKGYYYSRSDIFHMNENFHAVLTFTSELNFDVELQRHVAASNGVSLRAFHDMP